MIAFYFTQYGYSPLYGANTLTRTGFLEQYAGGVYRYRVLGTELVLGLNDLAGPTLQRLVGVRPEWMTRAVPGMDTGLFASHFLVNGAAFLVTSLILFRLLTGRLGASGLPVYLVLQVVILSAGWVITPYDFVGYALLVGAIAAFHSHRAALAAATPVLIAIGTLNRETQALAVAYLAVAVLSQAATERRPRAVAMLAASALAFVLTYAGLRLALGVDDTSAIQKVTFGVQSAQSMIGVVMALLTLYVVQKVATSAAGPGAGRAAIFGFGVMLPYLAVVALSGFYVEYRLFVPVFLVQALLICVVGAPTPGSLLGRRTPRGSHRKGDPLPVSSGQERGRAVTAAAQGSNC